MTNSTKQQDNIRDILDRNITKNKSSIHNPKDVGSTVSIPRLLTLKFLITYLSIPRSTLYYWIGEGRFPRPLLVGHRSVRWRREDIDEWLKNLPPSGEGEL